MFSGTCSWYCISVYFQGPDPYIVKKSLFHVLICCISGTCSWHCLCIFRNLLMLLLCGLTVHAAPMVCPSPCRCDSTLQHINCSDGNLSHIKQLSLSVSTISLMLDQNSLTSLPATSLHALPNLQFLAANSNNITHLGNGSLCAHNRLLHLFLEYNHITWIEADYLKDCHDLLTLELRSNYLYVEDIALLMQHMPVLETLDISNNQFYNNTILPAMFSNLKNLKYFYIDEMQEIRTIGPDFFQNLNTSLFKEFSLARNMITSISNETFVDMLSLNFLDISQTMITSKNLKEIFFALGQTHLQKLNMKSVFVYRGKGAFIGSHFFKHLRGANVHVLHAEGNFAGFQGKLEKSSLVGLQHLHELYLDDNELHWIHGRTFAHLSKLKVLSLTHNLLSCNGGCEFLSHTLPQLTTLILSNNVIDNSLEEVLFHDSGVPKLRHLLLDRNRLRILNPLTFILPFLHSLDLSENPISFIETGTFSTMSALKTLKMGNCIHLEKLNPKVFAGLYNLESLTLNHNRLSQIDNSSWFGLNSLKQLELSNNDLCGTSEKPLNLDIPSQNLSLLDLSHNHIQAISIPEISLESLVLKHNQISNLQDISYSRLQYLLKFDVSFNYLHNLPEDDLHDIRDIKNVVLEGNPLFCDCNALPLQEWSEQHTSGSNLFCSGPADKAGFLLTQVDLCAHQPQVQLALMVTFLLLFIIVSLILAAVTLHSGLKLKTLFKVQEKKLKSSRQSIQTIEDDTELKESLSGSSQCLNLNYCLSTEEREVSVQHGREPLMFYSQDVQSTI